MNPNFHLSIGVHSTEDSINFYTDVLNAKVLHRDPSGYVNIDLYGTQITLKQNSQAKPELHDFHFGVNLDLNEFNQLSDKIFVSARQYIKMEPAVWDGGTPLERKKMYLKDPTGYLVELKGYK